MWLHVRLCGGALISIGLIGLANAIWLYHHSHVTGISGLGNLIYLSQGLPAVAIVDLLWKIGTASLVIPALLGGLGLLFHRDWARTLGVVISGVFLLFAPVGTLVGAYCLWVLLSADSDPVFETPLVPMLRSSIPAVPGTRERRPPYRPAISRGCIFPG